eukprot:scaffold134095_cov50-Prasinocladus_malaysianus.AAC.1
MRARSFQDLASLAPSGSSLNRKVDIPDSTAVVITSLDLVFIHTSLADEADEVQTGIVLDRAATLAALVSLKRL